MHGACLHLWLSVIHPCSDMSVKASGVFLCQYMYCIYTICLCVYVCICMGISSSVRSVIHCHLFKRESKVVKKKQVLLGSGAALPYWILDIFFIIIWLLLSSSHNIWSKNRKKTKTYSPNSTRPPPPPPPQKKTCLCLSCDFFQMSQPPSQFVYM